MFFLDDYTKVVPESDIRGLTPKQKSDPLLGKTFYDEGNSRTAKTKHIHEHYFPKGLFTVLAKSVGYPIGETSYWCERKHVETDYTKKREVILFGKYWINKMLKKNGEK